MAATGGRQRRETLGLGHRFFLRRRGLLTILVVALVLGDAGYLAWRWHRDTVLNASITYIGLDSINVIIGANERAVTFEHGQWYVGGQRIADANSYLHSKSDGPRVLFVGLTSPTPYGQFVRSIRDLKARGICHVAIREGGTPTNASPPYLTGGLDSPGLLLCGHPLGDAGVDTPVARDHDLHVDQD